MTQDARGPVFHKVASNRAGLAIDATNTTQPYVNNFDGTVVTVPLMVVNQQKRIKVADWQKQPAIASSVLIVNRSGQACTVLPTVARTGYAREDRYDGSTGIVAPQLEVYPFPIYLAANDSITLDQRIVEIIETNVGAGTQAGRGVCYVVTLEPSDR